MRLTTHTRRQLQRHALGGQLLTLAAGLLLGWLACGGRDCACLNAAALALILAGAALRHDAEG